ncbi:MAG: Sir2 family NAD-dependent protein deacetylase [Thermodesulfobacteriota bacterium]|nr:Sir2 family NAD-dependent protein deacetylase [Thermodesulfobacteriota bacterium]
MDSIAIEKAAHLLLEARHAIVLSGAGISTESGVPDFRSPGGIWARYDPGMFFYDQFIADPGKVWQSLFEMQSSNDFSIWDASPNEGHLALARMEKKGIIKSIITQNIDNLHQKAGSSRVIEFHGNMLYVRCIRCHKQYRYEEVLDELDREVVPKCSCGGILKPDVVFFGEAIGQRALFDASNEASLCDLMLVTGTSAQVEPAASLPLIAKGMTSMALGMGNVSMSKPHCHIIEINNEPTPLTGKCSDFIIQGSTGEILSEIEQRITASEK